LEFPRIGTRGARGTSHAAFSCSSADTQTDFSSPEHFSLVLRRSIDATGIRFFPKSTHCTTQARAPPTRWCTSKLVTRRSLRVPVLIQSSTGGRALLEPTGILLYSCDRACSPIIYNYCTSTGELLIRHHLSRYSLGSICYYFRTNVWKPLITVTVLAHFFSPPIVSFVFALYILNHQFLWHGSHATALGTFMYTQHWSMSLDPIHHGGTNES
jgi:hypothetical protein